MILAKLKQMRIHEELTLYQEGDKAEEIYFILHGNVTAQVDILPILKQKRQEKMGEEFLESDDEQDFANHKYMPINIYVEGSYFGDFECLVSEDHIREF
mmetsp:Transcript_1868/g.1315  ORF Transcript_1868/g.1315 Transcript_1868/m.1315 type:complete len:99 (+) Transcript_1868:703-999(+)